MDNELHAIEKSKSIKVGDKHVYVDEFEKIRHEGKICFHLKKSDDGFLIASDGRMYTRKNGALMRVGGGKKMSKKARRKMRKEAFAKEVKCASI
jgi:hypothetical protein